MRLRVLSIALLFAACNAIASSSEWGKVPGGQTRSAAVHVAIDSTFSGLHQYDFAAAGIHVHYPAERARMITTVPAWVREYEQSGVTAVVPFELDLWPGLAPLTLTCDTGGSADPNCRLLRHIDDPDHPLFEALGTDFVFTADGHIWAYGHADSMYDHRRLFTWNGSAFVETPQPFRHVEMTGRTKVPIALRAERGDQAPVTWTVPAGAGLRILLNDNSSTDESGENPDYLVVTQEGLVGWAHLPSQPDGKTDVEGLYYRGD